MDANNGFELFFSTRPTKSSIHTLRNIDCNVPHSADSHDISTEHEGDIRHSQIRGNLTTRKKIYTVIISNNTDTMERAWKERVIGDLCGKYKPKPSTLNKKNVDHETLFPAAGI